jgi:regulator of replication initiation timing
MLNDDYSKYSKCVSRHSFDSTIINALPPPPSRTLPLPYLLTCRKRRGFASRLSSFHGVIAWCLLLATLLWSVKTRSSLSQQLAELRQFSSSSESETFDKMSKMTKQIADKNKEIGDLNKTQRANQRSITDLETEKTALQANIQAAKDETVRCTQREVRLFFGGGISLQSMTGFEFKVLSDNVDNLVAHSRVAYHVLPTGIAANRIERLQTWLCERD